MPKECYNLDERVTSALTSDQLRLLRLAQVGEVPLPRELRHDAYFGDVEMLLMIGPMEPSGEGFALMADGARYLEQVSRPHD